MFSFGAPGGAGTAGAGVAGGIGSLLQGLIQRGGFGDLEDQLRKAISGLGTAQQAGIGFLQPFQEFGLGALGTALPTLQQLTTDPSAVRAKLLQGFGTDPGEEAAIQEGLRARRAAASAAGTLGTSGEATAEQQFAEQQKQQDLARFLGEQTGLLQTGLGGLQAIGQQGLGAGTSIADLIANIARMQAQARGAMGGAELGGAQSLAGGIGGLISDIASFF